MATTMIREENVTLQDGREVTVRPLNIKNLRKFMSVVQKFQDVDETDDMAGLDLMVEAVQIALEKAAPDIADNKDYLEENLDIHAIHQIMNVAGGVDMAADPNLPTAG